MDKGNLGFRRQVGLYLENCRVDWWYLRGMVLAAGGNLYDVAEILIWRLRDQRQTPAHPSKGMVV